MDMKQTNAGLQLKAGRKQMSDTVSQMNGILTSDVVHQKKPFLRAHICRGESFEQGEIHILLLFPFVKVDQCIRGVALMPGTGGSNQTSDIASF